MNVCLHDSRKKYAGDIRDLYEHIWKEYNGSTLQRTPRTSTRHSWIKSYHAYAFLQSCRHEYPTTHSDIRTMLLIFNNLRQGKKYGRSTEKVCGTMMRHTRCSSYEDRRWNHSIDAVLAYLKSFHTLLKIYQRMFTEML